MIEYRGVKFEPAKAELVVLDRGGEKTWGVYIKCRPLADRKLKEPQFNLYGLPLPDAGIPGLVGMTFSLSKGESRAPSGPEALIYAHDWSPANDNILCIYEHKDGAAVVSWRGTCEDPDRYDADRVASTFDIQCSCQVRHEVR